MVTAHSPDLNPPLQAIFKDYAGYHQTRGNQVIHIIAIPLIVVSLLGLLSLWTLNPAAPRVDAGLVLWALAAVYYLRLDAKIAAPFCAMTLAAWFLGRAIPVSGLWTLFVGGWIAQFVGHYYYEKKSPAFLTNVQHFLIGPLWVYAKLSGALTTR